ncbi:MAG: T9SS type A sorting domain-containing protein [Melioribacteraceae bacterium]|nr:T9SS type A sorting domain-containing protein [Melioribacteraceae bacterium]
MTDHSKMSVESPFRYCEGAIVNGKQFGRIVTIEDDYSSSSKFILEHNYPNPFNPSTSIGYYLPDPGKIKISVYYVQGQEVVKLYEDWQQAGYHEINFNTKDLSSPLASGTYFIQLACGTYHET